MAGVVWSDDKGELGVELTDARAKFNAQGGLEELKDASRGKKSFDKGTTLDTASDGALAWGRWVDGKSKLRGDDSDDPKGKVSTLHYFTATSVPTGPTSGLFTAVASTSPTVQSNGNLVATGAVNSAGGTFTASLVLQNTGSATYSLTVPVAGQTFSLTGTAAQTSLTTFAGVSQITSTGSGCQGGCTGSLGNNVSVIGQIAGTQGAQAGVLYGFDSRLGNVSGVIVFKR